MKMSKTFSINEPGEVVLKFLVKAKLMKYGAKVFDTEIVTEALQLLAESKLEELREDEVLHEVLESALHTWYKTEGKLT
jgi:hypothetical protein